MNYLKLINKFWRDVPYLDGYKSDYGILYFSLLDFINTNNWRETEIEYDRIINKTRIGKRMYLEARAWLLKNNVIQFKTGRGDYAKAKFWVIDNGEYGVQKCTASVPASDTASVPASDTASVPHLNKGINYKTNKPLNNTINDFQKNENLVSDSEIKKPVSSENGGISKKEKKAPQAGGAGGETEFPFEVIWGMYGKKGSIKVAQKRYEKVTEINRAKIFEQVPKYVASTPEVQFRKNFEVYLNQESYNDQIIQRNANTTRSFRDESKSEYAARVASELNEIFEIKFGRNSNEPAHEATNVPDGYTSFSFV